ncbi:hypothetical protein BT69DRAFT_1301791 [Atractiella rhizophila]|nr:hypothetical protein BT69DRAFT_1301791 [Atractiella rhizophila]
MVYCTSKQRTKDGTLCPSTLNKIPLTPTKVVTVVDKQTNKKPSSLSKLSSTRCNWSNYWGSHTCTILRHRPATTISLHLRDKDDLITISAGLHPAGTVPSPLPHVSDMLRCVAQENNVRRSEVSGTLQLQALQTNRKPVMIMLKIVLNCLSDFLPPPQTLSLTANKCLLPVFNLQNDIRLAINAEQLQIPSLSMSAVTYENQAIYAVNVTSLLPLPIEELVPHALSPGTPSLTNLPSVESQVRLIINFDQELERGSFRVAHKGKNTFDGLRALSPGEEYQQIVCDALNLIWADSLLSENKAASGFSLTDPQIMVSMELGASSRASDTTKLLHTVVELPTVYTRATTWFRDLLRRIQWKLVMNSWKGQGIHSGHKQKFTDMLLESMPNHLDLSQVDVGATLRSLRRKDLQSLCEINRKEVNVAGHDFVLKGNVTNHDLAGTGLFLRSWSNRCQP